MVCRAWVFLLILSPAAAFAGASVGVSTGGGTRVAGGGRRTSGGLSVSFSANVGVF